MAAIEIKKDYEGFEGKKLMRKKKREKKFKNQENQHKRGHEQNKETNQSIMAEIKDNQNS